MGKNEKKSWLDVYSLKEKFGDVNKNEMMVIDVGNGKGHTFVELADKCKELDLHGKSIPQTRTEVLDSGWQARFISQIHQFLQTTACAVSRRQSVLYANDHARLD